MRVLFPSDPLDRAAPDPAFAHEVALATERGLTTGIVNTDLLVSEDEALRAVRRVSPADTREPAVYRGWMVPVESYARLYFALGTRGLALITDPHAYRLCHHLPSSYPSIAGHTPLTVWTGSPRRLYRTELAHLLRSFGHRSLVLKDYVKSEKHAWNEACFIPDASDLDAVERVLDRFLELRGGHVEGGFVFREHVELEPLGTHPLSGMPLTREHRLVFWRGSSIAGGGYWEDAPAGPAPPHEPFATLARRIESPFFTMDVARRIDGEWIVIELGDGQVAGLREDQGLARVYDAFVAEDRGGTAAGITGAAG